MRAPGRRQSSSTLAGWLFADLFLVLFLTSLAIQAPAEPATSSSRSPSPSPSSSPSTGASSCPAAYELKYTRLEINNISFSGLIRKDRSAGRDLLRQLDQRIAEKNRENRYAGLILAFGVAPNDLRDTARSAAESAGSIITRERVFFHNARVRTMNFEAGTGDQLYLDVYFLIPC